MHLRVGVVALVAGTKSVPATGYASVYLTGEEAVKGMFPGGSFTEKLVTLTPEEVSRIEVASGQTVVSPHLLAWVDQPSKQAVLIDEVVGKHDRLIYAVGLRSEGTVQGVEILEYQQSYGREVRHPSWRQQLIGMAKKPSPATGAESSGGTLSSGTLSYTDVIRGVRRLVLTYAVINHRF